MITYKVIESRLDDGFCIASVYWEGTPIVFSDLYRKQISVPTFDQAIDIILGDFAKTGQEYTTISVPDQPSYKSILIMSSDLLPEVSTEDHLTCDCEFCQHYQN